VNPEANGLVSCRLFRNYLSGFRVLLLESYSIINKKLLARHGTNLLMIVQIPITGHWDNYCFSINCPRLSDIKHMQNVV